MDGKCWCGETEENCMAGEKGCSAFPPSPGSTPMTTEELILKFATEQWGEKDMAGIGLKVGEEAGEVAGALVKIPEGRATVEDLDKEVGDLLIVLSQIAAKRGTTLIALRTKRFAQIEDRAAKRVPCAKCDRGDGRLGHAEGCGSNCDSTIQKT